MLERMGRPSKGHRELLATRAAPGLSRAVRSHAEARGLTVSDYIAIVLADAVGRPEDAPINNTKTPQESLPMIA